MSNETKRDVFDDAAFNIETSAPDGQKFADDLRQRYDDALPDDLPVIPKAVAYAIEWFQQNDETIGEIWRNLYEDVDDDWHECPQLREPEEWMLNNQEAFTAAWLMDNWDTEVTDDDD